MIHANSRSAWASIDPESRKAVVLREIEQASRPVSDRELLKRLQQLGEVIGDDMNAVRPSVTALVKAGTVAEVHHGPDSVTGRTVRFVALAEWTEHVLPCRVTPYRVSKPLFAELQQAFPRADLDDELRRCGAWLHANPSKRKTQRGMRRFLVNWLGRSHRQQHDPMAQLLEAITQAYTCEQYVGRRLLREMLERHGVRQVCREMKACQERHGHVTRQWLEEARRTMHAHTLTAAEIQQALDAARRKGYIT